jgi:Cu/Ag efflux protein CusF
MRNRMTIGARRIFLILLLAAGVSFSMALAGCGSTKPAPSQQSEQGPRRYPLAGRVVSVNAATHQAVIDHGDIPGFMSAMTMGYSVKDPNLLTPLAPEDQITADVVVNGEDVHLENIVVVKKAARGKAPAAGQSQPASPKPAKQ